MQEGKFTYSTFIHEHTTLLYCQLTCSNTTGLVYFVSVLHNLIAVSLTKTLLGYRISLHRDCAVRGGTYSACLGGEMKIFKIRKFPNVIPVRHCSPTAVGCYIIFKRSDA